MLKDSEFKKLFQKTLIDIKGSLDDMNRLPVNICLNDSNGGKLCSSYRETPPNYDRIGAELSIDIEKAIEDSFENMKQEIKILITPVEDN